MSVASSLPLPSTVAALVGEDHHVSAGLADTVETCDGNPCMTEEEYREHVQVFIIVESSSPKDAVPVFWMHTAGLVEFGLPELELRDVPALYLGGAGDVLNRWGYYMVTLGQVIKAGERIAADGPIPLTLIATGSPDPFWWKRGITCIRLDVEAVHGRCEVCGDICDDDDHEDESNAATNR